MSDFRSTFEPDPEPEPAAPTSLWSGDYPHPETWPRRATERFQPRSRLNQALDVAQRIIDTPQESWARAVTPAREQLPVATRGYREPTLFTQPASQGVTVPGVPSAEMATAASSTTQATTVTDEPPDAPPPEFSVDEPHPGVGAPAPPAHEDLSVFGPGATSTAATALRRTGEATDPEALHMVVDLRPVHEQRGPLPQRSGSGDYGLGSRWGAGWQASAQGWVRTASGEPMWRPVVSTTGGLPQWDIDTYLGIVTAEVAVEAQGGNFQQLGSTLARGRAVGMEGLVEEAIERGAHAVIGVSMDYTPIGGRLLITISGTAVTLRQKQS